MLARVLPALLLWLPAIVGCAGEEQVGTDGRLAPVDAGPVGDGRPCTDAGCAPRESERVDGRVDGRPGDRQGRPDALADPEIDPQRIFDDVALLSSAAYEGRKSGSAGGSKARALVEARFTQLGLAPAGPAGPDGSAGGYQQPFEFGRWQPVAAPHVLVGERELAYRTDYLLLDYSGSGKQESALVFVGYALTVPPFDAAGHPRCPLDATAGYDDFAGIDVRDKVVLAFRHGPRDDSGIAGNCPAGAAALAGDSRWDFAYKARNARLHGAAALLVVSDYAHGPEPFAGSLSADGFDAEFPVISLHRQRLEAHLPALRDWQSSIDSTLRPASRDTSLAIALVTAAEVQQVQGANVLARLNGADPGHREQVVLLGAHFDHLGIDPLDGTLYAGADDNASGTAVMLELARVQVERGRLGRPPARSLLFAGFDAEEDGLIGSCTYVDAPTVPLSSTTAMLSLDMLGGGRGSGLYLFGATLPANAPLADQIAGAVEAAGLPYLVQPLPPLESGSSDHACFVEQGVPALAVLSIGTHPYAHTADDTIANIRRQDLEAAARSLWAWLRLATSSR